jgi:hypothetical protein
MRRHLELLLGRFPVCPVSCTVLLRGFGYELAALGVRHISATLSIHTPTPSFSVQFRAVLAVGRRLITLTLGSVLLCPSLRVRSVVAGAFAWVLGTLGSH